MEIRERYRKALETARAVGELIGQVSRLEKAVYNVQEEVPQVVCEIDPSILESPDKVAWVCSAGNYLASVDIKTLSIVCLEIVSAARFDVATIARVPRAAVPMEPEPEALRTPPEVRAKPLLALTGPEDEQPHVSRFPVDPQSPVVIPRPDILERLFGIPKEGIEFGAISNADIPLLVGGQAPKLRVPTKVMFQHVLTIGTTGAGKTSFLKNLLYTLSKWEGREGALRAHTLVIDVGSEFVQCFLPNRGRIVGLPYDEDVKKALFGHTSDFISGFNVLLPVTQSIVNECLKETDISPTERSLAAILVLRYFRRVLHPWLQDHYIKIPAEGDTIWSRVEYWAQALGLKEFEHCDDVTKAFLIASCESPFQGDKFEIKLNPANLGIKGASIVVRPFAFAMNLRTESAWRYLARINPYFTPLARESLPRAFKYALREVKVEATLDEIARALEGAQKKLHLAESTLRNMIRNLLEIAQWGILNVSCEEVQLQDIEIGRFLSGRVTALDLSQIPDDRSRSIFVLETLRRVFEWKETPEGRVLPTFVVIDEAHRFFPGVSGREEEDYVRLVSTELQRIAREGRKRRLSLIFSTQRAQDIHPIIRGLCNTKVIFRAEESDAEVLSVPTRFRSLVTSQADFTALVISPPALRQGCMTMKVPTPITEHVDLSVV